MRIKGTKNFAIFSVNEVARIVLNWSGEGLTLKGREIERGL